MSFVGCLVCCLLIVVRWFAFCWWVFVVCSFLFFGCWLSFGVCCVVCVVCWLVACCSLRAICRLLCVGVLFVFVLFVVVWLVGCCLLVVVVWLVCVIGVVRCLFVFVCCVCIVVG